MRTKLEDRSLPNYTRGEEIFNMVSHIVGAAFGLFALIYCVIVTVVKGNGIGIVSSVIYGLTMVTLYTMSSIYHGLIKVKPKKVFQVLDHCTIYFLIAGTYTPIILCSIYTVNPTLAIILLVTEWLLVVVATTLTAIDLTQFSVFSMICYILMGWLLVFFAPIAIQALTVNGFLWLLFGGIAYTVGAITYGIGKKKKYMHNVFHVFCIIGSVLHFVCIALYVI